MDSIDEAHVSEPGLVVLDITARDEETAAAVMSRLDELWATSGVRPVRRVAEPGVRAPPVRRHPTPRLPQPGMTIRIRARLCAGPAVAALDSTAGRSCCRRPQVEGSAAVAIQGAYATSTCAGTSGRKSSGAMG
ncbi:DUF6207 family protein [Streptomyces sp. 5-10]|uniref:DUF6207 family protein n=1 Tax=Streptomyces sp. 5-10 TaxID=878925 RepID=UPI001CC2D16D|nr:DUF6207 family protein [Streptomyces sp. 5-10]